MEQKRPQLRLLKPTGNTSVPAQIQEPEHNEVRTLEPCSFKAMDRKMAICAQYAFVEDMNLLDIYITSAKDGQFKKIFHLPPLNEYIQTRLPDDNWDFSASGMLHMNESVHLSLVNFQNIFYLYANVYEEPMDESEEYFKNLKRLLTDFELDLMAAAMRRYAKEGGGIG